ncbi:hypothetical protein MIDIC_140086 [Alphaproteobacteria bacterium]
MYSRSTFRLAVVKGAGSSLRRRVVFKKRTLYKEVNYKTKEEFLEKISSISRDNLVYIDESGI